MSRLDEWLDELTELVDGALDIEAGLADAMLSKRVESLDEAVHAVLDVEAGLRAILPDAGFGSPAETWIERFTLDLTGLSPRERLTLRSGIQLADLEFFELLAESWETCGLVIDRLASMDVDHAGQDDWDCIAMNLSVADDLAQYLSDRLSRASGNHLTSHAKLAHKLRDDVGLALSRAHPNGCEVVRTALTGALDHAQHLREALYVALFGAGPDFGTITAGDLDELLGTAPPAVQVKIVGALRMFVRMVTDFTDTDLTDLDLHGIDLRGMQWSTLTTRWPPDWEREVRDASVQIDPEGRPDLYEVKGYPRLRHTVQ